MRGPSSEASLCRDPARQQRSELSFLQTGQIRRCPRIWVSIFCVASAGPGQHRAGKLAVEADGQPGRRPGGAGRRRRWSRSTAGPGRIRRGFACVSRLGVARFDSATARADAIKASLGGPQTLAGVLIAFDGQVAERLVQPSQLSPGQTVYRSSGGRGPVAWSTCRSALDRFTLGSETELLLSGRASGPACHCDRSGQCGRALGLYPITSCSMTRQGCGPGFRVEVPGRGILGARGDYPTIPLTAYRPPQGRMPLVFVVEADTGLATRDVELGSVTDEGVEVVAGLARANSSLPRADHATQRRDGDALGIGIQQLRRIMASMNLSVTALRYRSPCRLIAVHQ